MRSFALIMIMLIGVWTPAYAMCDLEPWAGKSSVTPALAIEKLNKDHGPFAFFGRVEVTNIVKGADGQARYDLKVLKQYEGPALETLSVYSQFEGDCAFLAQKGDVRVMNISAKSSKPYAVGAPDMHYYGVSEKEIGSFMDAQKSNETSK